MGLRGLCGPTARPSAIGTQLSRLPQSRARRASRAPAGGARRLAENFVRKSDSAASSAAGTRGRDSGRGNFDHCEGVGEGALGSRSWGSKRGAQRYRPRGLGGRRGACGPLGGRLLSVSSQGSGRQESGVPGRAGRRGWGARWVPQCRAAPEAGCAEVTGRRGRGRLLTGKYKSHLVCLRTLFPKFSPGKRWIT